MANIVIGGGTADGKYATARTSVWWDIENCQVPKACDAHVIAKNISSALASMDYRGPVSISAYGDTKLIDVSVQQALSSTGIALNHVPGGVKDASDKKILVDMLLWAVDNQAPANYLLISGDRDFSNALHQLNMRRYNILLAQPRNVSQALTTAARTVWSWTDLLVGGPPLLPSSLTNENCSTSKSSRNSAVEEKRLCDSKTAKCHQKANANAKANDQVKGKQQAPKIQRQPNASKSKINLMDTILSALRILREEKMPPTEANITEYIRYGELNIQDFDVRKALELTVQNHVVAKHKQGDNLFYIIKGEPLWKYVDAMDSQVRLSKKVCNLVLKFLSSTDGHSSMMSSRCMYDAASILKRSCLKTRALGEVLHILNAAIHEKKWILPHSSGWQPLSFHLPAISASDMNALSI